MRFGNWKFSPGLWPTLGMLVLVALFACLSVWQWHRAGEKRAMIAAIQAGARAAPVDVNRATARHEVRAIATYRHVKLRGRYDPDHQVLLDSMLHASRSGYYVLTPFHLAGTRTWVMVNRGWIAKAGGAPSPERLAVRADTRRITGLWTRLPRPGLRLGSGAPASRGWPKTLLYPTMAELGRLLQRPLAAHSVRLDAKEPDGYVRDWHPAPRIGPGRHIGYAFQWLGLALTVLIVWIVLNAHRVRREQS